MENILSLVYFMLDWSFRKEDIILFFIPKGESLVGNQKALFDYMLKAGDFSVVLVSPDPAYRLELKSLYPSVSVVSDRGKDHDALRLRCRGVVVSYGLGYLKGRWSLAYRAKVVNVWHGIGLKGMGALDEKNKGKSYRSLKKKSRRTDCFCVASSVERAVIAGSLILDPRNVEITGLPRNDNLLIPDEELDKGLLDDVLRLQKIKNTTARKLALYAPTFRDDRSNSLQLSLEEFSDFSSRLEAEGYVLGVRPHPVDVEAYKDVLKLSNVLDLSSTRFSDVTPVLRESDLLIADYSSIWVDYLLLDRPIIGFMPDFYKYQGDRGLVYDFEAVFPGVICSDFPSLISTLKNQNARGGESRYRAKKLFHKYLDSNSSRRVASLFE